MGYDNSGNNIYFLRNAFGETQEELGAVINRGKNTVSYYENGERSIPKDILSLIAQHYGVTEEDLINDDFAHVKEVKLKQNYFWEKIDSLLPVISSEAIAKDKRFQRQYLMHREIYKDIADGNIDTVKLLNCFNTYEEMFKNNCNKNESAANYIALWSLLMYLCKTVPSALSKNTALITLAIKNNNKAKSAIENMNESFEKDAKEVTEELNGPEDVALFNEMIKTLKRSEVLSDLGDYYLALQYVWGFVNNNLSFEFNSRIGTEMMMAFSQVDNKYAYTFLEYSAEVLGQVHYE